MEHACERIGEADLPDLSTVGLHHRAATGVLETEIEEGRIVIQPVHGYRHDGNQR